MPDNMLRLYDDDEDDRRPARQDSAQRRGRDNREDPPAITVLADEQGVVSDVLVPADWRNTVSPRDLGGALRDAANKAIMDRVAAQAEQFDPYAVVAPQTTVRPHAPSAHGDPTSPVAENLVNEVLGLFSRFDAELATYSDQVRQQVTTTQRAEGPGGRIVVTLAAGQVSTVEADDRWATAARHTEIQAEATQAFRAAFRHGAAAGSDDIPLPPSITRLHELAGDPEALCRQLGLSR